jgi:hypothetical protein
MPNLYLPNFALILTLREWELESRGVVAGGTTIAAATTTASLAGAVAYQKASHKAMPLLYPSIIFQVPCLLLVALLPRVQEILWQKFGRHRSHLLLHSSRGECERKGGFFFSASQLAWFSS